MFLRTDEKNVIVGVSDSGPGFEVPDHVGEEVEALLLRQDVEVQLINGDIRVNNRPDYWNVRFREHIKSLMLPQKMKIDYGDILHFDVALHLPIITAFASGDAARNRSLCDLDGNLHMLTTYEWKNVLDIICDILSQLAQLHNVIGTTNVHTEIRYNELCQMVQHKVNAAYGRP